MGTKTSVTTIVTTVLITLITILVILSMGRDRTANIILGVILMVGLFVFAGAMVRSSDHRQSKKTLEKS
jgi:uncharacterized membrane protein YgdD (TMEM256/DUF423 family)